MNKPDSDNLAREEESKVSPWQWGWSFDPSKISIYTQAKARARKHSLSNISREYEDNEGDFTSSSRRKTSFFYYATVFLSCCSLGLVVGILYALFCV